MGTLYEEWNRIAYKYDPVVQFAMVPVQGRYINLTEAGFRLNGHPAPWPPDSAAFNIFMFGGSTTFGVGLPDSETIPAAVEEYLNAGSCRSPVRVYNFGRPRYVSVQERALFEYLLASETIPQVAVFIDGLNDSVWLATNVSYTGELSRMMDLANSGNAWRSYSWAREFVMSLPMSRLVFLLRAQFGRSSSPQLVSPDVLTGEEMSIPSRVDRWIVNKRLIDAAAREFAVKTLFVWQLVPTYNYDPRYNLFSDDLWKSGHPPGMSAQKSQQFYELMNRRRDTMGGQGNFLWLADMQQTKRENLYVDTAHYTAAFSKEIGRTIADDLRRRSWAPCG